MEKNPFARFAHIDCSLIPSTLIASEKILFSLAIQICGRRLKVEWTLNPSDISNACKSKVNSHTSWTRETTRRRERRRKRHWKMESNVLYYIPSQIHNTDVLFTYCCLQLYFNFTIILFSSDITLLCVCVLCFIHSIWKMLYVHKYNAHW